MGLAVPGRHSVARGFEDQSPSCSDHHTEEDDGGSVVLNNVVDMTDDGGQRNSVGDAQNQREGTSREQNEARKNKDMNDPSGLVARMLPLPQPKLPNSSQSGEWPVKTKITFSAKERRQALGHNVGKACDA